MVLALFNGLLGALCGVWFRVQILVPLIAFAFIEVAIVNHTVTWSSAFWLVIAIVAIEVGYLAGSSYRSAFNLFRADRGSVPNMLRSSPPTSNALCSKSSKQQTGIAVGVEPIASLDLARVSAAHHINARESADQHEQRRVWQMKVG